MRLLGYGRRLLPELGLGSETFAALAAFFGSFLLLSLLLCRNALLLFSVGVALVDGTLCGTLLGTGRDLLGKEKERDNVRL